jgi:hypothetical protein
MSHSTPFPLLRTYLSRAYNKSRFFLLNYSLSLAGLVLTIVGSSAQSVLPTVLGVVITIAGIFGSALTWYRSVSDLQLRYLNSDSILRPKSLGISGRLRDSGYEILTRRGHLSDALLTSKSINKALVSRTRNPNLIAHRKIYHAGHPAPVAQVLLKEFTQSGTVIFNAQKVRIAEEPLLDNSGMLTPVHVQRTKYFDTLITNDSLSYALWSKRNHNDVFNGHEFCFPRQIVQECSESSCANQVGASTLAVTSDGYLVITEQGRKSNKAPGELAPSGAGSADWRRDARDRTDLYTFVKDFAIRELLEECGLEHSDIEWLKIIGYGRLLDRGGLPQFFCLAKLKCEFRNIRVTRPERPLTNRHLQIYCGYPLHGDAVRDTVVKFARSVGTISPPLWWSLTLLSQVKEEDLNSGT